MFHTLNTNIPHPKPQIQNVSKPKIFILPLWMPQVESFAPNFSDRSQLKYTCPRSMV